MNKQSMVLKMWQALLDKFYEGKMVSTFKGKETFQIASFSDG
ncbi:hypothetical protein [Geobacillus stearothermophilus]|nr:hypothetical protein [Geobacillus stearothermophilus]